MKIWSSLLALLLSTATALSQGILIPASHYAVQGAPFTLTFETRWNAFDEGGQLERTQRILRDSAGRQRYESPISDGIPKSSTIDIYDVVSGKSIKLDTTAKTAEVAPMNLGSAVVLDVTVSSSSPPSSAAEGQTLLGTKVIAGLEAWGERTVKNTTRDNGSVFTQDRELWTSTHYRIPLKQVMRRPSGTTTQTVVSLIPGEPDPALFQIPKDFTVTNAPPPQEPEPGTVRIGGKVSAPVVLHASAPEFSEEARHKKVNGNVRVYLIVDEQGMPQNVRVLRGIGMGLDEKAVEAVRKYRFKPAMRDGIPVRVEVNVDVNFHIF